MVGSELNRTRGKRGGIPGDIGASSFPSSFCVASIFARSLTLIPRSLHRNHTERLASQAKSPLVFFPGQFFARALQSERLEQAPTSARTQEPSDDRLLPLLVCLFFLFFFFSFLLSIVTFYI